MGEDERSLKGWEVFCKMTGMKRSTAFRKRKDLMDSGAIYYVREGKPPKKIMRFFPSIVKRWTGIKSAKGEII